MEDDRLPHGDETAVVEQRLQHALRRPAVGGGAQGLFPARRSEPTAPEGLLDRAAGGDLRGGVGGIERGQARQPLLDDDP